VSAGNSIFHILSTNSGVTAIVGALPACQVYPRVIPQSKTPPAVVYNVIAGMPVNVMDEAAPGDHELFQIDAWANDYDTATTLINAIRVAFESQTVLISEGIGAKIVAFNPDAYEEDTKRYSRSIGLSVWTAR
jgi:hypothetical protein